MHAVDKDERAAAQLRMAIIREEHLDDRPKALAALKAVLAHDANHREALGRLGRLYAQSGKPNDALGSGTSIGRDVVRGLLDSASDRDVFRPAARQDAVAVSLRALDGELAVSLVTFTPAGEVRVQRRIVVAPGRAAAIPASVACHTTSWARAVSSAIAPIA